MSKNARSERSVYFGLSEQVTFIRHGVSFPPEQMLM